MIVCLRVFGSLAHYLGGARIKVELPGGATLRDLMNLIDSRWGARIPAQLWDSEAKRFRGPVTVMLGGNDVQDEGTPLSEQDEVFVLLPLAGGSDIGFPIDKVQ